MTSEESKVSQFYGRQRRESIDYLCNKRKKLENEIKLIDEEVIKLREECTHPKGFLVLDDDEDYYRCNACYSYLGWYCKRNNLICKSRNPKDFDGDECIFCHNKGEGKETMPIPE